MLVTLPPAVRLKYSQQLTSLIVGFHSMLHIPEQNSENLGPNWVNRRVIADEFFCKDDEPAIAHVHNYKLKGDETGRHETDDVIRQVCLPNPAADIHGLSSSKLRPAQYPPSELKSEQILSVQPV